MTRAGSRQQDRNHTHSPAEEFHPVRRGVYLVMGVVLSPKVVQYTPVTAGIRCSSSLEVKFLPVFSREFSEVEVIDTG